MRNIVPAKAEAVQEALAIILRTVGLPDSKILAAYNRERDADADAKVAAAVAETVRGE